MVGRRDAPPVGRPYQVPGCTDPVPFVQGEGRSGGLRAVSRRLGPCHDSSPRGPPVALLVALLVAACGGVAGRVVRPERPVRAGRIRAGRVPGARGDGAADLRGRAARDPRLRTALHGREPRHPARGRHRRGALRRRHVGLRRDPGRGPRRVQRPGPDRRRDGRLLRGQRTHGQPHPGDRRERRRRSPAARSIASTPRRAPASRPWSSGPRPRPTSSTSSSPTTCPTRRSRPRSRHSVGRDGRSDDAGRP